MIDHKPILNCLPGTWSELKLKEFIKLTDIIISEGEGEDEVENLFVGADNILKVISVLVDIPVDQIEELNYHQVAELINKVGFITAPPEPANGLTIQWKNIEEIKYNDFVTYLNLSKEPFKNLPLMMKTFAKNQLSEQQIQNLGMDDVMAGFFLLNRQLKTFLKTTAKSLAWRATKQTCKEIPTRLWQRFKRAIKRFKAFMVGCF